MDIGFRRSMFILSAGADWLGGEHPALRAGVVTPKFVKEQMQVLRLRKPHKTQLAPLRMTAQFMMRTLETDARAQEQDHDASGLDASWPSAAIKTLLRTAVADVLASKLVLGGAEVAAADHGFHAAKLPTRYQSHRPAARARHDGDIGVLSISQRGLVFKDENRAGIHSLGDPFFQELQVG
jgi:hypothetical protein